MKQCKFKGKYNKLIKSSLISKIFDLNFQPFKYVGNLRTLFLYLEIRNKNYLE